MFEHWSRKYSFLARQIWYLFLCHHDPHHMTVISWTGHRKAASSGNSFFSFLPTSPSLFRSMTMSGTKHGLLSPAIASPTHTRRRSSVSGKPPIPFIINILYYFIATIFCTILLSYLWQGTRGTQLGEQPTSQPSVSTSLTSDQQPTWGNAFGVEFLFSSFHTYHLIVYLFIIILFELKTKRTRFLHLAENDMIYLWRLVKEHKPKCFTVIYVKKWAIDLIRHGE